MCAYLPERYSTNIWIVKTTFLRSAQQEKQENEGKREIPFMHITKYVITLINFPL